MAACAAVVGIQGSAGQGISMAAATCASGCCHQACVAWSVGAVQAFPGAVRVWVGDVTERTITATGRNGCLQGRADGMAVGAEAVVGGHNGAVHCVAGVVTTKTRGGAAGDITLGNVINVTVDSQFLVRVAIQAVGRVRTCGNRSDNLRTGAVVTGVAGPGAICGDVVLSYFDLGPCRYNVTSTTESTWSFVGQIVSTFGYCVAVGGVKCFESGGVTGHTVATTEGLVNSAADQAAVCVVTAGATGVGVYARQGIH